MGGGEGLTHRFGPPLAAAALAGLYLALAAGGPLAVGAWQDDAIYLATAKSLAEGRGYRHAELPGEPLQAKYPIGYPAVLAALWYGAPGYPANVPLLLAPTALAAAAFVWLAARYCRRSLGASRREAAGVAVLAALAPALLSMVRFTMSDLLYAALAAAALAALDRAAARGRAASGALFAAGLLVGAAALTRSIGVTLAFGGAALLLLRRRGRGAALFAALVALCLAPWLLFQAWAADANAAAHASPLLRSELSYAVWMPRAPGESLRVAFQNLFRIAFGLLYFELALPPGFAARALEGSGWHAAALHTAGFGTLALALVGFVASARAGVRALHACAAAYGAAVLFYPGDPYRFLLPWTPFLLFFLLRGTRATAGAAARRAGLGPGSPRAARAAEGALAAVLAALFAAEASRIAASSDAHYHFRVEPRSFAELRALEQQVRELTLPRDVIVSGDAAALYLATARQGYPLWPRSDPYALFYGEGRSLRDFTIRSGPSAAEALDRELREKLVSAWRAAGVDWYVDNARPDVVTNAVRRFAAAHPDWFRPRARTPGSRFQLYRVRLPDAPPRAHR